MTIDRFIAVLALALPLILLAWPRVRYGFLRFCEFPEIDETISPAKMTIYATYTTMTAVFCTVVAGAAVWAANFAASSEYPVPLVMFGVAECLFAAVIFSVGAYSAVRSIERTYREFFLATTLEEQLARRGYVNPSPRPNRLPRD